MKITGIRDDLYNLLDINAGVTVSDAVKADCANALNQALQQLNLSKDEYFLSEEITQALTIGTANYALEDTIQRVVGPVRIVGGPHLREIRSKGQYEGFSYYLDGATSGAPRAYFLDSRKASSGGDAVAITLYLAPAPAEAGSVKLDVIKDITAYTAANMADTDKTVPVAHQYVESLLLPIARYYLTRSRFFTNTAKLESLAEDYQAAMVAIGLAEPVSNPVRKTKPALEEAS